MLLDSEQHAPAHSGKSNGPSAGEPIGIVPERVIRCQQARAPWAIVRGADFTGAGNSQAALHAAQRPTMTAYRYRAGRDGVTTQPLLCSLRIEHWPKNNKKIGGSVREAQGEKEKKLGGCLCFCFCFSGKSRAAIERKAGEGAQPPSIPSESLLLFGISVSYLHRSTSARQNRWKQ